MFLSVYVGSIGPTGFLSTVINARNPLNPPKNAQAQQRDHGLEICRVGVEGICWTYGVCSAYGFRKLGVCLFVDGAIDRALSFWGSECLDFLTSGSLSFFFAPQRVEGFPF